MIELEQVRLEMGAAALRTLEILSAWARANPGGACILQANQSGKLEVLIGADFKGTVSTPCLACEGEDLRDACAQAARTIVFNGGRL